MADGVGGSSGGGIHPGAPIIWPTSKKVESISTPSTIQQAGQVKSAVSGAQSANASSAASAASSASSASAASTAAAPAPTVVRAMTPADLISQLLSIGLQPSPEMRELAGKMLQNGLELSAENFQKITTLLRHAPEGSETAKDAAIQTVLKGLENSPKAMTSLASFLANSQKVSQQMQKISQALAQLQSALASPRAALSPQLQGALANLAAQFDKKIQQALTGADDAKGLEALLSKSESLSDAQSLKQLVGGMLEQLNQQGQLQKPENRQLAEVLKRLQEQLESLSENMVSQAVLSKNNPRTDTTLNQRYIYGQIPNPMTFPPGTAEILVKRDENQEKSPVNPKKTRVIIKFETESMGEVTIFIDVEENKVWYTFNTETDETRDFVMAHTKDLQDRMKQLNFDLTGMHAIKRRVDIKRYLMPKLDLDSFTRISAEV